jgi:hypothetical protein
MMSVGINPGTTMKIGLPIPDGKGGLYSSAPGTIIRDIDFFGLNWNTISARRVIFENCNLGGTYADSCDFTGAQLLGCRMENAHFYGCDFTDAIISECDIAIGGMSKCVLTGATLPGTSLHSAIFFDNDLAGCDLSETLLYRCEWKNGKSPDGYRRASTENTLRIDECALARYAYRLGIDWDFAIALQKDHPESTPKHLREMLYGMSQLGLKNTLVAI